ncbi:MAG: protein-disulfide reductase DsbD family protein [Hyphomonadaceae bacterium]
MRNILARAKGWLAAIAAAAAFAFPAIAQPTAKSEHAEVSLVFERSAATPGDTLLGAVKFKLADKWHIYWRNPGDSGLPPTVEWASSPQVTAGEFKFPAPYAIPLGPLMNYAYEHEVVFPFDVKIAAGAKSGDILTIGGKFDYLICADICIPESVTLTAALPVEKAVAASEEGGAIIMAALPTLPVALTGHASVERTANGFKLGVTDHAVAEAAKDAKAIRFFPDGPELINSAKQIVRTGPDGVSLELRASDFAKPGDAALSGVVVLTKADGSRKAWEVPAAPGAAPAGIADKEFINADVGATPPLSTASNAGPPQAALDVGGLFGVLVFAFLGGLVLNLMPCVLPVLTIKAAGLVHTAHDPAKSRAHGLAYLAGVLVCFAAIGAILIGLKAAGDNSAGLGFQLQYAWVVAFFALVMFAVGLNLLGVFEIGSSLMGVGGKFAEQGGTSGAFFTGLLAAFVGAPCVGPFMAPAVGVALTQPPLVVMAVFLVIGLGLAAPFVLLSFTPAFAKILPKPGRWMETFRQVLAFPMFATVLWLLWVLAGQAGTDGVIAVLGGGIALAFGIWLSKKIGSSLPGRIIAGLIILAAFVVPAVMTTATKAEATSAAAVGHEVWSPEKVQQLRAEGRVIFVDFTARWCVTCQFNKSAMNDPAVQKLFGDLKVAFLEADWTNKDSVIAAALAEHGRAGVPLYLVYPANGGEPQILDQILSVGMIEKAVKDAAGTI